MRLDFRSVSRVELEAWSGKLYSREWAPGTIFLLGPWGETGGLIKLTRSGHMLSVTRRQVFLGEPLIWPDQSPIRGFQILGDDVKVMMREPLDRSPATPPSESTPSEASTES